MKTIQLTTEQKARYLSNSSFCPLCQSSNIDAGAFQSGGDDNAYSNVNCNDCGAEWTDEYRLSNIDEVLQ